MRIPIREYIALLAKYMRPRRSMVLVLGVVLLAQVGVQLANPQVLRVFVDQATGGGTVPSGPCTAGGPACGGVPAGAAVETLAAIAVLFIGVALAQQALVVAGTYLSQDIGWSATNVLRAELVEHSLSLDMSLHKTRTPGEWIERIDGDVTSLANFFSQFVMLVLGNALLLGAVLVVTWLEDWRIGLALTAFALCALAAMNRTRHFSVPFFVKGRQAETLLYGELEEHLAGLDDIRANGAGGYVALRFAERQRAVYRTNVRAELSSALVDMVSTGSFAMGYIGALALGAWLFQSGAISLGTIFLVLRYTQMLREPVSQITRQMQDLQKASAGIVRINQLLALRPGIIAGDALLPAGTSRAMVSAGVTTDGPAAVHALEGIVQAGTARPGVLAGVTAAEPTAVHDLEGPAPAGRALPVEFANVTFAYADDLAGSNGQAAANGNGAAPAGTRLPAAVPPSPDGVPAAVNSPDGNGHSETLATAAPAAAPGMETVLRGVDFRMAPGSVLGLLGRTGSGKTTVARLLARLYDPTGGAIRLGGVDIRAVQTSALRHAVGMVTQDVQMFSATLRENLTLFDERIPDARIHAALAQLGLAEWYGALPAGLDSRLSAGLSAGEAQLLAFTRVMLRDPALVILDEASSRLDPATERLIERAVDGLLQGRSAIIIAHRLGTVQRASDIVILEAGQIVEQGPRARLAADPGSRFAQLLRTGMEEVLA